MEEPTQEPGRTVSGNRLDIAAAKKRCEAATPEPWKAELDYLSAFIPGKRPNGEIIGRLQPSISDLFPREQKYANAQFIAHARTDLPAALEALEEAQGKIAEYKALYARDHAAQEYPHCETFGCDSISLADVGHMMQSWKKQKDDLERQLASSLEALEEAQELLKNLPHAYKCSTYDDGGSCDCYLTAVRTFLGKEE